MQQDFDFDAHAEEYESILGKSHEYYLERKMKLLQEQIGNGGMILDAACGTGQAERYFQNIIGIDLAGRMLRIAKKKTNAQFVNADVLAIPFADDRFDMVFSTGLMHHLKIEQRQRAISELARVTKSGGYVVTFEHNPRNLVTKHIVKKCVLDCGVQLVPPSELVSRITNPYSYDSCSAGREDLSSYQISGMGTRKWFKS
jgi:ubiquinone/menaquinone biosynthesis C-methylase UbiE